MINIGVIGYGYWGPNLVRNFVVNEDCNMKMVADNRSERLELVNKYYPSIETVEEGEALINNPEIDAVVVAVPVSLHYPLAKKALEAGKHVLVEKPLTTSVEEAEELIEIAHDKDLTLMVDHTFLYTGAVQKMHDLIQKGEIGNIEYFDSIRINLGLFQSDINVIWDLAPHDLSILQLIKDETPTSVVATGISHTNNNIENLAYLTLKFQSNMIAHFNCSWTSPVKIRKILIGGDEKMIVYDDVEPTEKVKIYNTSYRVKPVSDEQRHNILVDYRVGDISIPKVENKEALAGLVEDFVGAIDKGKTPISNWESGLEVTKTLVSAQQSLKEGGKEIQLK